MLLPVGCDLFSNTRLGCKSLPGTNTLAYLSVASATKKKVFKNFRQAWDKASNPPVSPQVSTSSNLFPHHDCFGKISQSVCTGNIFQACPIDATRMELIRVEHPSGTPLQGRLQALPSLQNVFQRKRSSLFCRSFNDCENKKFHNIDYRDQCYKTFYGRNL